MKKISLKLFIFTIPFVGLYLMMDPFKVLRSYDDYSKDFLVAINRNYVSTEVYLKNHIRYDYDSFIFGSSRTMGYRTNDWRIYLGKEASPFVYSGDGETISHIYDKIRFLNSQGSTIKNALIILSTNFTFSNTHVQIDHPAVSGGSWAYFHYVSFKAFYRGGLFLKLIDFKIFEDYRDYRQKGILYLKDHIKLDTTTNDLYLAHAEKLLSNDSSGYYLRFGTFFPRDYQKKGTKSQVTVQHQNDMNGIMDIFKKHNTTYRVIIDPLYNQIYINPDDLNIISNIFGNQNVYDFTGENEFTESIYNYYDFTHYRPHVGKELMKIIYR